MERIHVYMRLNCKQNAWIINKTSSRKYLQMCVFIYLHLQNKMFFLTWQEQQNLHSIFHE